MNPFEVKRVFCGKCASEGKKSTVTALYETTTTMGFHRFYGEDGMPHNHDPNRTTERFRCSNGHEWQEIRSHRCHCGWTGPFGDEKIEQ